MKNPLSILLILISCTQPIEPDEPIDIVSTPIGQPTLYKLDSITKVHTSQIVNLKKADSLMYWQTVSGLITRIAKVETNMSILVAKDIKQDTTMAIWGRRITALVADTVYQRNQIIALQKTIISDNLSVNETKQINALILTTKNSTIKILQDSLARLNIRLLAKEVYLDKGQFTINGQTVTITQLQSLLTRVQKLEVAKP